MVAINHSRAQILAPHREVDPWAGLDRAAGVAGESEAAVAGDGHAQGSGVPDPWGQGSPTAGG